MQLIFVKNLVNLSIRKCYQVWHINCDCSSFPKMKMRNICKCAYTLSCGHNLSSNIIFLFDATLFINFASFNKNIRVRSRDNTEVVFISCIPDVIYDNICIVLNIRPEWMFIIKIETLIRKLIPYNFDMLRDEFCIHTNIQYWQKY